MSAEIFEMQGASIGIHIIKIRRSYPCYVNPYVHVPGKMVFVLKWYNCIDLVDLEYSKLKQGKGCE